MGRSAWWSLAALTLVSIMSLAACRDGRKAETLDRATALVLLRETPARSYRGLYWSAPLSVFVVGPANEKLVAVLRGLTPDLLTLRSIQDAPDPSLSFDPFAKKRIVKRYEFALAKPGTAEVDGSSADDESARFPLATADFKEVTGVVQQGSQAAAEVVVAYTPNETYRRIQKAIGSASPPGVKLGGLYALPDEQVVARTTTRNYSFTRYDDGWRLQPRLF
jgi:hypothetical protein